MYKKFIALTMALMIVSGGIGIGTVSQYANAEDTLIVLTDDEMLDIFEIYPSQDFEGGYEICGIKNADLTGSIEIPASVKGMPIVGIGDSAFSSSKISSIKLPSSIMSIGENAFMFSDIEEIVLPDSIRTIGDYAFSDCKNLKEVTLPGGCKSIPVGCFTNCVSLEEVEGGNYLSSIGKSAFDSCKKLSRINSSYSKRVYLPRVEIVGDSAFLGCESLKEVGINLSDNVKHPTVTIGERAFYGSSITEFSLTSDYAPSGISDEDKYSSVVIGSDAFYDCIYLKEVTINLPYGKKDKNTLLIKSNAFSECEGLESFSTDDNTVVIEPLAFDNCISLSKFEHSRGSDLYISNDAFSGCMALGTITRTSTECLATYDNGVFNSCISLYSFDPTNSRFKDNSIEATKWYYDNVENEDGLETVSGYLFKATDYEKTDLIFDDNIKGICDVAFVDNKVIESITIPGSVLFVSCDFSTCTNLKKIVIESTDTIIMDDMRIPDGCKVFVAGVEVNISGDSKDETLLGDANCDSKVTIADTVAILQFLANADEYALSEQGVINADCYSTGDGINTEDAHQIQIWDSEGNLE